MRKIKRRMAVLLLVMVMLISGGCQNMHHLSANQTGKDDADTGTGYNIYYITTMRQGLRPLRNQLSSTTEDGIISECMEALSKTPDDKNYQRSLQFIGEGAAYNYDKDSRTLSLFFSKEYAQMPKTTEMLVRTAIVETMTQFGGIIDYVSFSIDGSWMTDEAGNVLRMKNSDYVSEVGGSQGELDEERFCLYYVSSDGSGLVRTYQTIRYPSSESPGRGCCQNTDAGISFRKIQICCIKGYTAEEYQCERQFMQCRFQQGISEQNRRSEFSFECVWYC